MTVLFDDLLEVHYGFFDLLAGDVLPDEALITSRKGQVNGLVGAAVPGRLQGVTGLHTGGVPFRVEWSDAAPPLAAAWQDVVEASVELSAQVHLVAFEDAHSFDLPQGGWHRARFCAIGIDEGHQFDTALDDEDAPDRYLLQLWPAPPAPDAVVRQHAAQAAYWHGVARDA